MPGADDAAAHAAPPVAHAIGGAIGSALALLLFFPLERARIELQAQASLSTSSRSLQNNNNNNDSVDGNDVMISNDELESMEADVDAFHESQQHEEDEQQPAATIASVPVVSTTHQEEDVRQYAPSGAAGSPSSSSWTPIRPGQQDNRTSESPSTWSLDSPTSSLDSNDGRGARHARSNDKNNSEEALLPCLLRLHKQRALYQGVTPVITTIATSQFVFFYLNEAIKQLMTHIPKNNQGASYHHPSPILSLFASCLAGVGNVLITSPLWVSRVVILLCCNRTRLALSTYSCMYSCEAKAKTNSFAIFCMLNVTYISYSYFFRPLLPSFLIVFKVCNMAIVTGETETSSLWKELRKMIKERGWKYMWNGTSASLLLVSNPVVQFFCYEQIKEFLLSRRQQRQQNMNQLAFKTATTTKTVATAAAASGVLLPYEAFIVGALAKGIATVATYPLQLAQTVLRLSTDEGGGSNNEQQYRGTLHCLLKLYQKGGLSKLFTGMRAKLLQTVLTAAFTFLTYGTYSYKFTPHTLFASYLLLTPFNFISFKISTFICSVVTLYRTTIRCHPNGITQRKWTRKE